MGGTAADLGPASGSSSQCTPTAAAHTVPDSAASSDAGASGGGSAAHARANTTGGGSDGDISDSYDEVPRELGAQVRCPWLSLPCRRAATPQHRVALHAPWLHR